jgi:hypothetical protein
LAILILKDWPGELIWVVLDMAVHKIATEQSFVVIASNFDVFHRLTDFSPIKNLSNGTA